MGVAHVRDCLFHKALKADFRSETKKFGRTRRKAVAFERNFRAKKGCESAKSKGKWKRKFSSVWAFSGGMELAPRDRALLLLSQLQESDSVTPLAFALWARRRKRKRPRGHVGGVRGRPRKEARNFGRCIQETHGYTFVKHTLDERTPEKKFKVHHEHSTHMCLHVECDWFACSNVNAHMSSSYGRTNIHTT